MNRKVRNEKRRHWLSRRARVLRTIGRGDRTRLTVFRTARHIYAQLDDPITGNTIATVSTRSKRITDGGSLEDKTDGARRVGKAIAEIAREKQIEEVVFNRNGFLFHGRVKALAEAARKAGLRF